MLSKKLLVKYAFPTLGVLAIIGTAAAAISLTYSTTSSQALSTKPVPVTYIAGADSGLSDYVTAFSISTNKTSFSASVKGVPEATVVIGDLVDVSNVDSRAHTVTISTTQNTNALVTAYKIDWFDGVTNVGTLDFKTASPSVTFTNMAAGKTYVGRATITLAAGSGLNNIADPALTLSTTVSS